MIVLSFRYIFENFWIELYLCIYQYYKTNFLKSRNNLCNNFPLPFHLGMSCPSSRASLILDLTGRISLSFYPSWIVHHLNHPWVSITCTELFFYTVPVAFRWYISCVVAFVCLYKGWCSKKKSVDDNMVTTS